MHLELIDIATERSTALTDLLLALLAAGCGLYLRRFKRNDTWKTNLWTGVFGLVALGSLLGTAAHGFVMSQALNRTLWKPLYLSLGLAVGLFMVGAVYDAWGRERARRTLPVMIVAGLCFFAVTQAIPGSFLVFVVYEAFALFFALVIYGRMAMIQSLPGAAWNAAGVLIMIVAAGVQATKSVNLFLVWPFDHNGVFHLIQMAGLGALTGGLAIGLKHTRRRS